MTNLLSLLLTNIFFHDGVEQTSWQAILEVIISPKYRAIEKDLAHALISYFSEEVVNIRLFFHYVEDKAFIL